MFNFFRRKRKQTENEGPFFKINTKEILLGIKLSQKRNKIDKHHITFLNAYISKRTYRQLKRKKYNVEILSSNNSPSFKVSW